MTTPAHIINLDKQDELASVRDSFALPEGKIYLDGNSLGPLPIGVKTKIKDVVEQQWGSDLIESWNLHQWIELPTICGEKIAPIVGAGLNQVICCDSISINLYKLLGSALSLRPNRNVILSQSDNFPTDLYVTQSFSDANKCQLKLVNETDIAAALDDSVAIIVLTEVNFRSGARHDIKAITRLAHEHGALLIWDLAHSAGAVPLELDKWEVDFAVGCGYKFLNGGPGAPAFVYIAQRHQESLSQPLSGWMGHVSPFSFDSDFESASGPKQFLSGTPNILSMAALDSALDVFDGLDMQDVFEKSQGLSELFINLLNDYPSLQSLELISPKDPNQRGSQVAVSHTQAYSISQALIDSGVIVDFREPNILRFGITPLYTRYQDIWNAVFKLNEIMVSQRFLDAQYQTRKTVT